MLHPDTAQWLRAGLSGLQLQVLEDPDLPSAAKERLILAISENVFSVVDELEGVIR